ncbi:MAG: ribosome biogenesis/translation initiation ATPase RLI [Nanoarchaeota archaeon]|nr:ribosome biogenesis/translation initiation ATPase RLI [Nanoarchaeota archaeon]MBU1030072.1 ribosome biogenesis/translation initiation ATPase RLI [Nanoarchaeota archaeon]MBU1850649.1 ribosome biogenesis/translation initiation ATPase RLI [Nanoarchaeota archaeon]
MNKRIMIVKKEKCNPIGCGGYLCIRVSPSNRMGKDAIHKSDDGKVEVNEEVITDGDRIAANKCPFNALEMINLPAELDKEPIHRYGKNGFALFNLPTPIFGKVVGIVGCNGIGKSTAIKILAGVLDPNLGRVEANAHVATHEELIDYFKGTEAQMFFEKRKKGVVRVAYKPQQVDMIPKEFSGTVRDLLSKTDEKNRILEITKELEIEKILDHDIKKISGGELQRVAIAATVLKKANIYFFDEPSSYLDMKQRLKVSKFIRGLADEETAVMVIEHDLIILDYMTDFVHLMYGKEGAFGIVSMIKTTKAGINVYLSGYLKEENIRFRDHEIKFLKKPPISKKVEFEMVSWDELEQDFGSFNLKVNSGKLYRSDTVGILGENGIGKTSFVRILAGVVDTKDKIEKLKVAYKPQYLEPNDELVMVVLKCALDKYQATIVNPLNLKGFLTKKLSELSGGELQRVMIAKCLSEDSDIILMDEPSAYLDVEQRLIVSKVIKDVMEQMGKSALIVDHDLLFIDYLSDRLIVFDGEPAVNGVVKGPFDMSEGMNKFLKDLELTFRRDDENNRPRANKVNSQLDREQKSKGNLYYS